MLLHLVISLWVPGCVLAAWWQVTVALAGNSLGYVYSVEWPVFAIFGVIAWWHAIHDDPSTIGAPALQRAREVEQRSDGPEVAERLDTMRRRDEEDEALAAYNDYLEELARRNRPKTWRN